MARFLLALFLTMNLFCLPASSDVAGKVVDDKGEPVANAKFIAIWTLEEGGHGQHAGESGESGVFTFPAPEDRWYRVYAIAKGFVLSEASKPGGGADLVVSLKPGITVKGKVVDESGSPIEGAKISQSHRFAEEFGDFFESYTDSDGAFTLDNIANPLTEDYVTLRFSVRKPGFTRVRYREWLTNPNEEILITQTAGCGLEGILYLPGKIEPAPEGTLLTVNIPTEEGRYRVWMLEIGEGGRFETTELPEGEISITLGGGPDDILDEYILPAYTFEASTEETAKAELVLAKAVKIAGKVTDVETGEPLMAYISISDPSRPDSRSVTTNDEGEFNAVVTAGEVVVSVRAVQDENGRYISKSEDERPSIIFTIAEGEEKTDIAFEVERPEPYVDTFELARKPISPDFELVPGEYKLEWDPEIRGLSNIRGAEYEGDEAAEHIKKLPDLVSDNPKFELYQIDGEDIDGLLAVVFDESQGTGTGYDTAYVDTNRNFDLSDEEPLKKEERNAYEGRTYSEYPIVAVQSRQGPASGEHTTNPIQLKVYVWDYEDFANTNISRTGAWKGKIMSNAGEIECAAFDYNSNGIFGDKVDIPESFELESSTYDVICADINEAGQLITYGFGPQMITLSDPVILAGKMYNIDVNEIGNTITISEYTGPSGKLVVGEIEAGGLSANIDDLWMMSRRGLYNFEEISEGSIKLPEGEFEIAMISFAIGEGESKLNISCSSEERIKISSDEETMFNISGELKSDGLNPNDEELTAESNGYLLISWIIKLGDSTELHQISGGDRFLPEVNFMNDDGDIVNTSRARYT